MYKEKMFVSFDYEKDKSYKFLLQAWSANPDFDFSFDDRSSQEIQTDSVSVVKQVLSKKINEAKYLLVIVGQDSNKLHKDSAEIGYINWQNYEISKAIELGKKIIAVRLDKKFEIPVALKNNTSYKLVEGFSQQGVNNALNNFYAFR